MFKQSQNSHSWPPPFTIKKSKRAKNIILKICPVNGLMITTPWWCQDNINQIINDKREWIEKELSKIKHLSENDEFPPQYLSFLGETQNWQLSYIPQTRQQIKIRQLSPQHLSIYGNLDEEKKLKAQFKKWIINHAKTILTAKTLIMSKKTKLPFSKVVIRQQKTQWGSCSSTKVIHLNYHLLFLPVELIEYVIIHELSHTQYLNHSSQFWQLVKYHCPHYQMLRNLLKNALQYIPRWLMT